MPYISTMDDIKNDPRFAHILSDPKFRSMPKSKRKVKIDSRFQSLFTSKHFSHRTDIDKRGRPVLDSAKRNKHVMERFYELSSDDNDEESDSDEPQETKQNGTINSKKSVQSSTQSHIAPSKRKRRNQDESSPGPVSKQKKYEDPEISAVPKVTSKKRKVKIETDSADSDDASENKVAMTNSDAELESSDSGDVKEEDDDDDDELPEFTQDHVIEETEIDHKWNEHHMDAPQVSESTHRLAVCNMDWDHVRAQDLFVLFKSFVPEGGLVKSVTIYPSEFGKERMAEEAMLGPKEIRQTNSDFSGSSSGEKKKKGKDQQQTKRAEKEKEALQTERFREYQLNRLRYYYAVVDCDSVRSADAIYCECDGREYLLSSVRLDLRFIPNDMTFDDEPKEQFSENQSVIDYRPNVFNSTALSQAKVDVTWDETDFDRLSKRISGLQPKELESIVEENKYADIIAPPESDSEDEDGRPDWLRKVLDEEDRDAVTEEEKIQMYRKLVMDKITTEEEEKKREEGEVDKEIEWQPGLKSSVEKKMKKKEKKKDDSVLVSDYLEKKREKKKRKKEEKLKKRKQAEGTEDGGSDAEQAFSDDDIPDDFDVDEMRDLVEGEPDLEQVMKSKVNKKKKKAKKPKGVTDNDEELDAREKAELELMLMSDGGDKSLTRPELVETTSESKISKKKKKKLAKLKKQEQEKEDFVLDVNDPRFAALYTSHHFHIDPNAPQFKKTKNMTKLVNEQIKRKGKKQKGKEPSVEASIEVESPAQNSKSVSQSLLESLKKKMKKK